jgi:hypothetical protein
MDLVDLTKELTQVKTETIPALIEAGFVLIERANSKLLADIQRLTDDLHELLDRLNQATITTTITIPPKTPQ